MNKPEDRLSILGNSKAEYPKNPDEAVIETFENRSRGGGYSVEFDCPEFTCLCPKTGQPDFGRIKISYVPGERCIESKSLKFYLFSFRNEGMFNEEAANRILNDLVKACRPEKMEVQAVFTPRGGISITVRAGYPGGGF
jgi:7-cyano-7-deazaguanine reductase